MITKTYNKSKKICKATFSLPKEATQSVNKVALVGEFNNWNQEEPVIMKKAKDGSFKATVELPLGRNYQFRYIMDNGIWENDWKADDYVFDRQYNVDNSVVFVDKLPTVSSKKTSKAKATNKKGDDLKKIEGIGPKIAKLLNEAGIKSFAQLGSAKKATLQSVLDKAGPRFKMHNPTTWAKQGKLAAKGEWTKLEKLQKELNGGK